ncbi:hypothetical protein [Devosia ginsengisoli]|uniref:DUF2946 domain-containing protein n=1 Tax=Devosia ginsengisoli TaxID=400770 RepID=A0A5B8LW58_9HYPH|nr:hypothetical protein [Devosia ginsengisoli]QDZ12041.1 hypothetical protein FPZ08_15595 [Devosia ginsengisoli]
MTRLLGIAVLILALVALAAPSLSVGVSAHPPTSTQVHASSGNLLAIKPCKSLGGKRVLPCHPDLGVMVSQASLVFPSIRQRSWRDVVLPLAAPQPETELPPPRAA